MITTVVDGLAPEQAPQIAEWTDNIQVFETLRDLPSPVRAADMPAYVGALGDSADGVVIKTLPGTPMRRRGERAGNVFPGAQRTGSGPGDPWGISTACGRNAAGSDRRRRTAGTGPSPLPFGLPVRQDHGSQLPWSDPPATSRL